MFANLVKKKKKKNFPEMSSELTVKVFGYTLWTALCFFLFKISDSSEKGNR